MNIDKTIIEARELLLDESDPHRLVKFASLLEGLLLYPTADCLDLASEVERRLIEAQKKELAEIVERIEDIQSDAEFVLWKMQEHPVLKNTPYLLDALNMLTEVTIEIE